jgi:hypothetical protein
MASPVVVQFGTGVRHVHARNENRNVVFVAERARRRNHRHVHCEARFDLLGGVALHRREHQPEALRIQLVAVLDGDVEELARQRLRAVPLERARRIAQRIAVLLARRARRCRQAGNLKPRMAAERRQELLSGEPGRAYDTNRNS